jgi:hypothetical protein
MSVIVEEAEESIFELWKFFITGETYVVLEIVVEEMNGFWLKKFFKLWILMNDIT